MSVLLLFFFVVSAIMLYPQDTDEGHAMFPSMHRTVTNFLFVLLGSWGSGDIMLPACVESGNRNAIFFGLFYFLGAVVAVNLYLAIVFDTFKAHNATDRLDLYARRRVALFRAFTLLDVSRTGAVQKPEFLAAARIVKRLAEDGWDGAGGAGGAGGAYARELDCLWRLADADGVLLSVANEVAGYDDRPFEVKVDGAVRLFAEGEIEAA